MNDLDLENIDIDDIDIDTLLEETKYLVEKAKAEENAKNLTKDEIPNIKTSHFKEEKSGVFGNLGNKIISKFKGKEGKHTIEENNIDYTVEEKQAETYTEYAPSSKTESNITQTDYNNYKDLGVPIDSMPSPEKYGDIHIPPAEDEIDKIIDESDKPENLNDLKNKNNNPKKLNIVNGIKKLIGVSDSDPVEKERPSLFSFINNIKDIGNSLNEENDDIEDVEVDISIKENMENIFSTSEHTIRLTNTDPLDIEDEKNKSNDVISSEKNIVNTSDNSVVGDITDNTKDFKKFDIISKDGSDNIDFSNLKDINLSNDFDEDDELTLNILFGKGVNNISQPKPNEKDIKEQADEILRIQQERVKIQPNLVEKYADKKENIDNDNIINIADVSQENEPDGENTKIFKKPVIVKKVVSANTVKTKQNKPKVNVKIMGGESIKINNEKIGDDEIKNISDEKMEKITDATLKLIKDKEKEIVGSDGEYPVLYGDNQTTKQFDNIKKQDDKINSFVKQNKISSISKYTIPKDEDTIVITVGSFSKTVSFEYDNYKKISKFKNEDKAVSKDNIVDINKNKNDKASKKSLLKKSLLKKSDKKKEERVIDDGDPVQAEYNEDTYLLLEDYSDPKYKDTIKENLASDRKSLVLRSIGITLITFVSILCAVLNCFTGNIFSALNITHHEYFGIMVDFILILLAILVCRGTLINGFNGLFTKGNGDTAVTFAVIMVAIQDIAVFFAPQGYREGVISLYSVLALLALMLNIYGKLLIAKRVQENFKFVSSDKQKYVSKIYDKDIFANALITGTAVHKPFIAYQRKTGFLKDFLKLSYIPDSLELLSGKFANIGVLISLVFGVIYGIISKNIVEAISAAALCSCIVTPICNIFGFNIQLNKICSDSLEDGAMIIGTEGVKQFCDTNAVMLDVKDLYSGSNIKFCGFHPINNSNQDDCIKYATSLTMALDNPLCEMFMKMVKSKSIILPNIDREHTIYEDGKGIVGWVDGKRAFLGNKDLMIQYGINIPEFDYDEKYAKENKYVIYVAVSSKLLGMFVISYKANADMVCELQRMEENGISFLIRTTDCNITAEKISKDFGVYLRSVKILSYQFGNACKIERETKDKSTRAYMVTRGKMSAFCRALSACVNLKSRMSIVKNLQISSVIIGVVLCIILSLISGVSALNVIKPLIYVIVWIFIIWLVPKFNKL